MKKHIVLTLLISFCALSINAQTKRIAHRSHNGTSTNYFELEDDNLGLSPEMERRMSRRYDSIQLYKRLSKDSVALDRYEDSLKQLKRNKVKKSPKKTEKKKVTPKKPNKRQKTQPLPPNDESRNENKPKSNYFLLFLVAVPVSAVAFFSRKV